MNVHSYRKGVNSDAPPLNNQGSNSVSLAFNRINQFTGAVCRNYGLELDRVGLQDFRRDRAFDDLPLIVCEALDAFADKRLGGLRAAIGQDDFDLSHEPVAVGSLAVAVVSNSAFKHAARTEESSGTALCNAEIAVAGREGDLILPDDLSG